MSIFQNNKITACVDYVFYRVSKFYVGHKEEFELHSGLCFVGSLFAFWALSIVFVILGLIRFDLSIKAHKIIIVSVFLISFGVLHKRYTDRKLYEKLCKEYKNEPHSKIKGAAIIAVYLLTIALYVLSMYIEDCLLIRH